MGGTHVVPPSHDPPDFGWFNSARTLSTKDAAAIIGVSRGVVESWCRTGVLDHDAFDDKRPSRLISERELLQCAYSQPNRRRVVLEYIADHAQTRQSNSSVSFWANQSEGAAVPANRKGADASPAEEGRTPSGEGALDPAPAPDLQTKSASVHEPANASTHRAYDGELAELRAVNVQLREDIASLSALLEETEQSYAKKSAQWLALLKRHYVPKNPAALDGLGDVDRGPT